MAKYQCTVCGYIFDEAKEGKAFAELDACPVCGMRHRLISLTTALITVLTQTAVIWKKSIRWR